MNPNNRADLNPRVPNQTIAARNRPQNARLLYLSQSVPSNLNSAQIVPAQAALNQNSITNKLCKFFKNLLELEREQGRYDESVAIIQKYINKEIDIDELGVQLKGNASKAPLPDSLMTSLRSNIDDLRREMFYGRVKIDGINPPQESVIDLNVSVPINNSGGILTNISTASLRQTASQLITQRPPQAFQQISSATPIRQLQPQAPQIIRQTIQPNVRQIRAVTNNATVSFTPQPVLNISSANLRSIAPSSPIIRPNIQAVTQNGIRAVPVSSAASNASPKPSAPVIKIEETKSEGSSSTQQDIVGSQKGPDTSSVTTHVGFPTNIINSANFRNKISELFKADSINTAISDETMNYVSEAVENFSQSLLEQAAVYACHRHEMFSNDPMYKKIDDVRAQLKFLQELDDYQRASEEERHKAELFKAAKSRSKADNQEQQKIKETVRKIQEHDKNCDEYSRANMTALKAIGSKRKFFDSDDSSNLQQGGLKTARSFINRPGLINTLDYGSNPNLGGSQIFIGQNFLSGKPVRNPTAPRYRTKRIILKDFQLVLDQDVKLKKFKAYKKIFSYGRY